MSAASNVYELCQKEPTELTEDEILIVVEHLRKLRMEHIQAEAKGKRPGRKEVSAGELDGLLKGLL